MCYFNSFTFFSEKKRLIRPAPFLSSFRIQPIYHYKNLSVAVIATRSATRILLRERGFNRNYIFFAEKLSNLGPVLNKLMQLKLISEGALGGQILQLMGDFCDFAAKLAILTPFQSHFARF